MQPLTILHVPPILLLQQQNLHLPAEQNFAPQTLTQQRCLLLPIDANGNCKRVDMQGDGVGLPPLLGSQEKQQAHYNLPKDAWRVKQLSDGSCPADYHYNSNASRRLIIVYLICI